VHGIFVEDEEHTGVVGKVLTEHQAACPFDAFAYDFGTDAAATYRQLG
jgi:hypothetical protein